MIGWLVYTLVNLDPLALLGGAVFVFAAGMPVVGLMLGSSCSPCCGTPTTCAECTTGKLPNTIKVTLSNMVGGCLTTQEFVLKRGWAYVAPQASQTGNPGSSWYEFGECAFGFVGRCPQDINYIGSRDIIEVRYRGPDLPPVALFNPNKSWYSDPPGYPAQIEWTAEEPIENCSEFSWTATDGLGQTITVEHDGAWQDKADSGLPDTLTATFSGFKDYRLGNALCPLTFTAPYGSGAEGGVTEPLGYAPEALGPIGAVVLSNSGSGYARYGRVEPEITADPPEIGTDGALTVTLAEDTGEDGLPFWKIDEIAVDDAGSGYQHWAAVPITAASGVTVDVAAEAHIVTTRSEPSLTATAMSGNNDAVLSVTLEKIGGLTTAPQYGMYAVTSIEVDEPGTGYDMDAPVLIAVDTDDDLMYSEASAHIVTKRIEPTLSIEGNAVVSVTLTKFEEPPARWYASDITVTDGGSGYTDGETVAIVGVEGDETECNGGQTNNVVVFTVRDEPTLTASVTSDAGSGADLAVVMTPLGNVWVVDSVTVADGGADYEVDDAVTFAVTSGQETFAASGKVASVDGGGEITAVTVIAGGAYFLDTGVIDTIELPFYKCAWWHDTHEIESVVVDNGGAYYRDSGEIESVAILEHGVYYTEDLEAEPYVAEVVVGISQTAPSAGTGGEISAIVDADTSSPNFGSLSSLSIDNAGDGYLAGEWIPTCQGTIWNGREIVLTRGIPGQHLPFRPDEPWTDCAHSRDWCERCFFDTAYSPPIWQGTHSLRVYWNGSTTTPTVEFGQYRPWTVGSLSTAGQIDDCTTGSFSAVGDGGETIAFTEGGEYEPNTASVADGSCNQCCAGEVPPEEIEVQIDFLGYAEGETFVLPRGDQCALVYFGLFGASTSGPSPTTTQIGISVNVGVMDRGNPHGDCGVDRCEFKCVLGGNVWNNFALPINQAANMCDTAANPPALCNPTGVITGGFEYSPFTLTIL